MSVLTCSFLFVLFCFKQVNGVSVLGYTVPDVQQLLSDAEDVVEVVVARIKSQDPPAKVQFCN